MSRRLSKVLKQDIRFLAVNYQAFTVAMNYTEHGADRDNGIIVWGDMLRSSQALLGVEMIEDSLIRVNVDNARRRENERKNLVA